MSMPILRPALAGSGVRAPDTRRRSTALALWVLLAGAGGASGQPAPQAGYPLGELKKLSLEALQTIEVTSVSRHAEKLAAAPSSVQVITRDDIRRSGATSLPEALRLASNLQVAQIDARTWAISARGFNNASANKLLVLIDGRAVYTPLHAGVFWDVQDTLLEDVDRIEVISGPGATLWGANAVNGVINVITRSAKDSQGGIVALAGGSELRAAGGARYGGQAGRSAQYRVYGKYASRDHSALPAGGPSIDRSRMGQGGFRVDWETSSASHVTVQGDLYDGRIAQRGTRDIVVGGGNALGRWSRTVSATADVSLQVYVDRTHRDIPGTFAEDLVTADVDFQHRFRPVPGHDVVWGAGYRASRDDEGNEGQLAFLPAHLSQRWLSGFVQDEMRVGSRLRLTLGTKLERNDYTGLEVQPAARLAWNAAAGQTMWGAVSRAVRTPSRIDRDFFVPVTPGSSVYLLAGGPDFVSEDVRTSEIGYRLEPGKRLSAAVSAFHSAYGHIRSLEQQAPPAPFPLVIGNGQSATSNGIELTGDYRVMPWWRLRAGYTAQRIQFHRNAGSTDSSRGSREAHDPGRYGTYRQSLDLPGRLQLDAGLRYVGRIANQKVPAYRELDARIAWQPTRSIEYAVTGRNLLRPQHPEFGDPASRREIERSAWGQIVWRF